MRKIFERTFQTTLKLVNIIVCFVVALICGLIISVVYYYGSFASFTGILNDIVALQNIIFFFVLTGILLMVVTISTFTGLIAGEVHEGTIKLLATKSNSRIEILLAKVLGGFAGMTVLLVEIIMVYFATINISGVFDSNILLELAKYIPSYFLYGLFIVFNFGALATLLSCIFKKKVLALLPLLAFSIIIVSYYPMIRTALDLLNEGGSFSALFDFNYQLALIFKSCISIVGPIKGNEEQLMMYSYFTKLFVTKVVDNDISKNTYEILIVENNALNCYVTLAAYLLISIGCYVGSIFIFKKKDL